MQEDAVRQRLESLIRTSGVGYAALSRMIGRNSAYLQQFIKRGVPRRLAESDRHLLAQHFGISERLLGAPDVSVADAVPCRLLAPHGSQANPYMQIPFLIEGTQSHADAGVLTVDPSFTGLTGACSPGSLSAWRVRGDSMVPTLVDGDAVLIDCADLAAARDGIYAIRTDFGVLVKRISFHPVTNRLSIMSDNSAYPAIHDCDANVVRIIGRIIWAGRHIA